MTSRYPRLTIALLLLSVIAAALGGLAIAFSAYAG